MRAFSVSFCGNTTLLLPAGENDRVVYTRFYETREEAQAVFDQEPRAYQLNRWEPETNGWVPLAMRDRADK